MCVLLCLTSPVPSQCGLQLHCGPLNIEELLLGVLPSQPYLCSWPQLPVIPFSASLFFCSSPSLSLTFSLHVPASSSLYLCACFHIFYSLKHGPFNFLLLSVVMCTSFSLTHLEQRGFFKSEDPLVVVYGIVGETDRGTDGQTELNGWHTHVGFPWFNHAN